MFAEFPSFLPVSCLSHTEIYYFTNYKNHSEKFDLMLPLYIPQDRAA